MAYHNTYCNWVVYNPLYNQTNRFFLRGSNEFEDTFPLEMTLFVGVALGTQQVC